jgi:hypothetical protein
MARRFDLGRALLAAGALLLLASLFVEWFDTGQTGWEVFEALDLLLAGIALAAIYAAVRADVAPEWLPAALAVSALAIVVVQLIDAPPAAGDGDPSTGAWLALAASLLMAAGAVLSLARFAITVEMREHDRRRRMPAVDRRAETGGAAAPAAGASPGPTAGATMAEPDELDRTETFTALPEEPEPDRP